MFNKEILKDALVQYKKDFISFRWGNEKYKWEAVKCFRDNWDVNAEDFAEMLKRSLSKTFNLLASMNSYPAKMITNFAKAAPEEVRAMFIELFDESKEVYERIDAFKNRASVMLEQYGNGAKSHFQKENSITTYLWLRYPDKYYVYKYGEVKAAAKALECDYEFKRGESASNVRNSFKFYDELCEELKKDADLIALLNSQLTPSCYPDPELKSLTFDVGFYISRYYSEYSLDITSEEWWPDLDEYNPGFTKEQWKGLLNDPDIIGPVWGNALAEFYDIGGEATCSQIGAKYNHSPSSVSGKLTNLAKHIYKKTNCPLLDYGDGRKRYWPILFVGKKAAGSDIGYYIWKLRPELFEAIGECNIMRYLASQDQNAEDDQDERGYWWLNASPRIWSFSDIAVGEMQSYSLYNDNGNKRRIFQNFIDARVGDLVIGYESNPVKQVVALGRISSEQDGEKIFFEKTEGLTVPIDYQALKEQPELSNMEFFTNPNGSLFKLTEAEYEFIIDMIREDNPVKDKAEIESYTEDDFLEDVYMAPEKYKTLVGLLRNKKNIILQGAPGVGKTFTAKKLAFSMMKEKDEDRIEFVQFHQNYSYEDFMMGYKPVDDGFELKYGVFYRFCQKAANHPDKEYFFIIDEINRGNLSKIFGELLMLIETGYRGTKATLAYNGMSFSVPENLYIIGMMNTADRSLAMIDYALRRRFSFVDMDPGFETEGFIRYQKSLQSETFNKLIARVKELNNEITKDKSLGKGFCIGHSYFCEQDVCTDEWLREVVDYDIIPMLTEYWFDESDKIQKWDNILHGVFQ